MGQGPKEGWGIANVEDRHYWYWKNGTQNGIYIVKNEKCQMCCSVVKNRKKGNYVF